MPAKGSTSLGESDSYTQNICKETEVNDGLVGNHSSSHVKAGIYHSLLSRLLLSLFERSSVQGLMSPHVIYPSPPGFATWTLCGC